MVIFFFFGINLFRVSTFFLYKQPGSKYLLASNPCLNQKNVLDQNRRKSYFPVQDGNQFCKKYYFGQSAMAARFFSPVKPPLRLQKQAVLQRLINQVLVFCWWNALSGSQTEAGMITIQVLVFCQWNAFSGSQTEAGILITNEQVRYLYF
eukprot:TRINITY_DN3154_c0_g1_i3.p5 TRINITY_DN3154_c0_g1~~TRINITY_DN3154_c0_g1_i3.p5  ORF type:complete len:150 (+),score=4.71 TRINITY_DN3154_c0_g1_i3:146-595(+)